MAAVKKKSPVLVKSTSQVEATWPREVVVKNNTPFQFIEKVKSVILTAHSTQTVIVSESELLRIKHNFMQLNLLNNWNDGLTVLDSVGENHGDV